MVVSKSYLFFRAYENWFEDEKISLINSMFIYYYRYTTVDSNDFLFIKHKKYTIINDLQNNLDTIFSSFKKISRNCINKIDKLGDATYKINSITDEEFLIFYNAFANKKNLELMNDYQSAKYRGHILYLSGYLNHELSNIHVYIFDDQKKIIRFLYSISSIYSIDDTKKRNLIGCLNRYLYWKAICYFHNKSYLTMDMGGYANDINNKQTAGIDRYKESFSGKIIEIYDYESIPFYILSRLKLFIGRINFK